MARWKDNDWNLPAPDIQTLEQARLALLMDIRDELKRINQVLNCSNFLDLPRQVTLIRRNTTRRKKKTAIAKSPAH